ncbi:MAG: hypothetical protein ACAH07_06025 [Methylophilaceae bacterium]|nr:hypothetical protein [Methyloradius sp.]
MFKIKTTPDYLWPVTIEIPGEKGSWEKHVFKARFKRLSQTEVESLAIRAGIMADPKKDEPDYTPPAEITHTNLLDQVVTGIVDSEGQEWPWDAESKTGVEEIAGARGAIVDAWFSSLVRAKAKNS